MGNICQKFKVKLNLVSDVLLFLYNGEKLKEDKTFNEININGSSAINVIVYNKGPNLSGEINQLLKDVKDEESQKEILNFIKSKVNNANNINHNPSNNYLLSNNRNNMNEQISYAQNNSANQNEPVKFTYSVLTDHGNRYMDIHDGETAGNVGEAITRIAIKANRGVVKYRVHIIGGDWLPFITGYNLDNNHNGYAGNDKAIDLVQVTHDGVVTKYRVSPLYTKFYDYQYDIIEDKNAHMDGFAGYHGRAIDRFELTRKS